MIKKLRRKFVLIAAVSLFVVELLVVGTINVINHYNMDKSAEEVIDMLIDNGGGFPELGRMDEPGYKPSDKPDDRPEEMPEEKPEEDKSDQSRSDREFFKGMDQRSFNEETRYKTRFFVVNLDEDGNVTKVDTGHIAAVSSEKAIEYAKEVADSKSGYTDIYKYKVCDKDGGKMIVFLDCRSELSTENSFLIISVTIGASAFLIVLLLIVIFSKRAVKPVIENMDRQKQFITNAGHELKTPLAIISANTEVLELTSEPSEWTESIKNQVARLSELIKDMLNIARAEGISDKMSFMEFDVSKAVAETAEPFGTLAETNGKKIELDIEDGLKYYGDEGSVRQLTSVLTENAVKYSDDGGRIEVTLRAEGKGVRLSVKNPCSEPPKHPEKLFDRFYREDSSHARKDGESKGGYGIGLSVAAAIAEAHKGRISCHVKNGYISFNAHLGRVPKKAEKKKQA